MSLVYSTRIISYFAPTNFTSLTTPEFDFW